MTQITGLFRAVPFPQEGRIAIVTDVGYGMRWTRWHQRTQERADEWCYRVRQSRVGYILVSVKQAETKKTL